jgi:integrase
MSVRVLIRRKRDRADLLLYYVHPLTKREVSKSAETPDHNEAERAAGLWEAELNAHFGTGNDGWQHFRDRLRNEYLAPLSPKTYASYTTALNHFERLMKPSAVSEIDSSAISVFQSRLIEEKRELTSIRTYLTHLRAIVNWAEQIGVLRKAPAVKLPRQATRRFMRGRPLTEPEYRAMRAACSKLGSHQREWQRFLDLLWLSGLRLGEAIIVSWDEPPIVVKLDATPYPQLLFFAEGHKARRDEAVPIAPDFAAWLKKTPPKQRTGLVVPLPLASEARISEQISEIGGLADVVVNGKGKRGSAQDFRRSFGTRWAPHVMPLTLQKMMRHADISTTMKYYVNMSSADAGREIWSVPNNVPNPRSKRRRPSRAGLEKPAKSVANRSRR